jgi:hypothetical protein
MTTQINNSDLHFSSARELRSKFDRREISSVEATKTTLDRIGSLEPPSNTKKGYPPPPMGMIFLPLKTLLVTWVATRPDGTRQAAT